MLYESYKIDSTINVGVLKNLIKLFVNNAFFIKFTFYYSTIDSNLAYFLKVC